MERANPGAPAAQSLCLPVPRGPSSQWATTGPSVEPLVRAGHHVPGEPTLGIMQRAAYVHPCSGDPAPIGPPLGPLMRSVELPVRAGDGAPRKLTLGPLRHSAAVRLRPGTSTQLATAGAPEVHCGKEWWARQGKEPPTKAGWAEPRTTVPSQCSVKHLGHRAGAHPCQP